MTDTLPPNPGSGTQRKSPRWASRAAREVGLSAATVEYMVSGPKPIHERLCAVIRSMLIEGETELVERLAPQLQAALAGLEIPTLDDELVRWACEADDEESIDRTRYLTNKTPEHRRRWRISLETQRARGYVLLLAVQKADRLG